MNERETDDKLEELRRRTAEIEPPHGFSDRVMRSIELEPRPRSTRTVRTISLTVFAFAAAAAIFISKRAQSDFDESALSVFDSVELEQ